MHEITCNTCGEPTYLLERGEVQVRDLPDGKESPADHLERTGHEPRAPPEREQRTCKDCGNVWWYAGGADRPTCPNCRGKKTEAVDEGKSE
jgi:hypothetical protein